MAIIRLSCDRSELFAPRRDGALVETAYDPVALEGRLGRYLERDVSPDVALANSTLQSYIDAAVRREAPNLGANQPVVVLVHGFLFTPHMRVSADPKESDNAHSRLYHFLDSGQDSEIRHHTTSWPRWLGFQEGDGGAHGLCVAFCWHAQPGLAQSLMERFQNYYARAYDYGTESAWALANVIECLARRIPNRPIDIFCHSLGTHLVVRAVALGCKHAGSVTYLPRLGRIIMMGGAEYVVEAQLMYRRIMACPMGRAQGPMIYNIGCRENDVLDKLGENFGPRTFGNTNVIGHNGLDSAPLAERWIDLQIDSGELRSWLAAYDGLDVSGDQPGNVWDHWYYYTHRGNMEWYRRIFREREKWHLPELRRKVGRRKSIPEGIERGWLFGD